MGFKSVRTIENAGTRLYKVIYVVDGDCFCVGGGPHGQAREYIRLLCVDTPEKGQRAWKESKECLLNLVGDKHVRLEPEHRWRFVRDRFGRCLAYVFIEKLLVNAELVRLGWSDFVTKFGRGRFASTIDACKAEAELFRRGVWQFYQRGDSWAWGRGRRKPHFRNSDELVAFNRGASRGRLVTDGKICTDSGPTQGQHSSEHVQPQRRWSLRQAKGSAD